MKLALFMLFTAIGLAATPALASSDAAWAALNKASAKACIAATGFKNAKVSAPTGFSDTVGYDARIVTGTYPQKHMKNATGQMLCLYARKSKTVEVQELAK
ncbi:hypothetical protein [Aestuariivirga litoralis]|uniref:hypothetical protein n=1 Tax=Aestuariivirga litoralis TaxID=2650924 RepID=UPI0018C660D1|nr:hypothetical protein [Aestuariivirga litoralis]MBG1231429.1 hypothetical protein [Aestuariivirga litoralis]